MLPLMADGIKRAPNLYLVRGSTLALHRNFQLIYSKYTFKLLDQIQSISIWKVLTAPSNHHPPPTHAH